MPEERHAWRVAVRTLGCKVNQAESEAIAAELFGTGARIVPETEADVVVVNTCTVTAEADHKARKAIRHALRAPGAPVVVVTGCSAAVSPEPLAALGERVVVVPDKARVPEAARAALSRRGRQGVAIAEAGTPTGAQPPPRRHRVQVKIQDGCDCDCAYCIVPQARGVPRSVPRDEIVSRVRSLVAEGVAEVVLTGINLGKYDDSGAGLPGLVRSVAETGIRRIRLSSIEPPDVNEALLEVAAETPAFLPHLHIPLQSGSDRVLAVMGRTYDTTAFAARLAAARSAVPGLAVTTDVLVGFPGETDEELAETISFIEGAGFSKLHVFRFSARPGTRAAAMAGRHAADVIAERAARVREAGEGLSREYAAGRTGGTAEVLVETFTPSGVEGTSEDYLRVALPAAAGRPGDVVTATLTSVSGRAMSGRVR